MTPPLGQGLYPGDMGTISDNPDAIKAWLKDAQAKMSDMVARWQERADQALDEAATLCVPGGAV